MFKQQFQAKQIEFDIEIDPIIKSNMLFETDDFRLN